MTGLLELTGAVGLCAGGAGLFGGCAGLLLPADVLAGVPGVVSGV